MVASRLSASALLSQRPGSAAPEPLPPPGPHIAAVDTPTPSLFLPCSRSTTLDLHLGGDDAGRVLLTTASSLWTLAAAFLFGATSSLGVMASPTVAGAGGFSTMLPSPPPTRPHVLAGCGGAPLVKPLSDLHLRRRRFVAGVGGCRGSAAGWSPLLPPPSFCGQPYTPHPPLVSSVPILQASCIPCPQPLRLPRPLISAGTATPSLSPVSQPPPRARLPTPRRWVRGTAGVVVGLGGAVPPPRPLPFGCRCFPFAPHRCTPLLCCPQLPTPLALLAGAICRGLLGPLGFDLPLQKLHPVAPFDAGRPPPPTLSLIFATVWSSWVIVWLVAKLLLFLILLAPRLHVVFPSDRLSSNPQGMLHGVGYGA
jgi:hypothetical protein